MMSPKPKAAADSELSLAASAAGFSPEQAAVVVTAMFQHDLNCDSPAEVIAVMQRLAASDMLDIVVGGDKVCTSLDGVQLRRQPITSIGTMTPWKFRWRTRHFVITLILNPTDRHTRSTVRCAHPSLLRIACILLLQKSKKSQHLSEEVVAVMAGRAPAPTPRSKMLITTGSSSSTEAVDATAIHVAAAAMVRPSYASLASQPASRAGSRAGSRRNSKDTAGDHAESGGASAAAHSQALETIAQLPSLPAVFTSLSRWVQSQAHSGGSIDALVNSKALQLLFANVMRQQQASAAAVDDGDCESGLASCLTTIIGCGIDGGSGASAASAAGASLAMHAVSIGRTLCALHSSSTVSNDSSSAGASAVDALTTSLALRCAELLVGYRQAIATHKSNSGTNGGVSPSAGSKGSTSSEASEAASLISKAAAASAAADAANARGKIDLRSLLAAREAASAAMGAALNVVQSKSASAASPPAASVAAPTATVAPVNASMALSEAAAGSAVAVAECLARLASTSSAPSAASGGRTGAGARGGAGASSSSSSLALARAAEASARTTVAVITKEIGLVLQPLKERYNDAASQVQALNHKREQLLAALAAVDNEIVVASAKASEIEGSIRDVTAAYAPRLLAAKETLDRASAALVSADAVPVIQSACEALQRDLTASLQVAIDSAKPQAATAKPVVLAVAEEATTHNGRMSWLQTAALYAQQESKLINAVVSRASNARAEAAKHREGAAQLKALSVFEHLVAQAEEKADQLDAEADEDEGTAEQLRSAATRSLLGFVVVVAPMLSSLAPAELALVHAIRSHATAAGLEAVGEAGWRLPPLPAGVTAGHANAGVAVASPPAASAAVASASSGGQARAMQTPTGKQQAAAAPAPASSGKPPTAPKAAPAAAAPAPVVNVWGKPRPTPAPAAVTAAVDLSAAVIEPSAHASSAAAAAHAATVAVAGTAAPSPSSSSWGDQALAADHSASSVPAVAAAAAAGEEVVHVVDPQAQAQVASLAALTSPSASSAASPSSAAAPMPQRDRKRAGGKRQA